MEKVCIGVPYYGMQTPEWWNPLVAEAARLSKDGIELIAPIAIGSMATDKNRNAIVENFEKLDADWLMWVDADNPPPSGIIKRLLSTHKSLVTGVYVKRGDNPEPIMYYKTPDGMYQPIEEWTVGEIMPIDSAGLGGCLCHRSVFEDIKKNYRVLERTNGGIVTVHKDTIVGDIFDTSLETDGKVVDGVLQERLRIPKYKHAFPYFMLQYGRTEDYDFFEKAASVGHQLWADTSVEIGHVGVHISRPADWRKKK
jgi:hypothetical protein